METDPGDDTEFKLPFGHEAEIQAMKAEEKTVIPAPEGKPVVQRVAEPLPDDEPALDFIDPQEEEGTASEETLTSQAQPLQKAWNVERQRSRQNELPVPAPAPVPLESAILESIQPHQAVVQRLLDQVQPGQPSDSKVETLPPRKPRPLTPPAQPSAETAQFEASVQPLQAAAYMPAQPSSILPEGYSEPAPADPPASVNVTAADSDPEWEEMVETPAGILPASLASLLQGQASATTEAPAEKTSVQGRTSSATPLMPGDEHIVQRSPETSTGWSEKTLAGAETPSAVVQRTVEISEISAEPSSSPTSEGQAGEQANQPDIEELARKVYTEVKRKMAVERERNRR
jgi:hypothetical protein